MFDIVWSGCLSIAQLQTVILCFVFMFISFETFISMAFVCRFIWIHIVCCPIFFFGVVFSTDLSYSFMGLKQHSNYDQIFFCDRDWRSVHYFSLRFFFYLACVHFFFVDHIFVSTFICSQQILNVLWFNLQFGVFVCFFFLLIQYLVS